MTKVSILVPIYNVESYIERCARSLFEQTHPDIEYIFVDDCSPDHSIDTLLRVLENYPTRKNQVRIIKHDKNRGLAAARNTAVDNCTSDFLFHVDSDDYIEYDAIEHLVKTQKETNADIITGQMMYHGLNSTFFMEHPQFKNKKDFVADMIKPSLHHTLVGRLIRTSLYKDNQVGAIEGVNIGEDLQVMSKLAYLANNAVSTWNIVYHYDNTNLSSYMIQSKGKIINRCIQDTKSMEIVREFFKKKDDYFYDITEKYLADYYQNLLFIYASQGNKKLFNIIKNNYLNLKDSNKKIKKSTQFLITHFTFYRNWIRLRH